MNAYVSAAGRLILRSYAMPAALDLREARRWRLPNGRPVTARQIMLYSSAPPASGSLKPSASGRTYKALLIKQGATRKGSLLKKVLICLRAALGQFNQARSPTTACINIDCAIRARIILSKIRTQLGSLGPTKTDRASRRRQQA